MDKQVFGNKENRYENGCCSENRIGRLLDYIGTLEREVGRSKLKIEFLDKVVELCSEEMGYDVKKKFTTEQLSITE